MNPFSENEPILGGREGGRLEMGVRGAKPPAWINLCLDNFLRACRNIPKTCSRHILENGNCEYKIPAKSQIPETCEVPKHVLHILAYSELI